MGGRATDQWSYSTGATGVNDFRCHPAAQQRIIVFMADKEVPAVPFQKKTKKYGTVTVTALCPSPSGGLAEITCMTSQHGKLEEGAPFWVRAKLVLGHDLLK